MKNLVQMLAIEFLLAFCTKLDTEITLALGLLLVFFLLVGQNGKTEIQQRVERSVFEKDVVKTKSFSPELESDKISITLKGDGEHEIIIHLAAKKGSGETQK